MSVARRLGLGLRLVSVRADVRAPESRGGGWEAAEAIPARGAEAEGGEAAAMEVAADGQLAEEEAAVAAAVAETALGESDA